MCITIYTFLCPHDYHVKMPNATFCFGRKHAQATGIFFPSKFRYLRKFNSKKVDLRLTNSMPIGIIAKKIEIIPRSIALFIRLSFPLAI